MDWCINWICKEYKRIRLGKMFIDAGYAGKLSKAGFHTEEDIENWITLSRREEHY